ncbi:MAG: beta-ketoacyl-ACP synthase III [Bdellovibrionota bacterium]
MTWPVVKVASVISGTGMSLPERVVTNEHFAKYLETSDEWIRDRTGIRERRWVESGVTVSELAEPAARQAIAQAGLEPKDVDAIVFATVTPDNIFPSSACCLQRRLGMNRGFAFDVNAVCSGFLYALVTADSLIARGVASNVLVVGADIFSKIIDPQDRTTCILFGDGAGAVMLTSASSSTQSGADGNTLSGRADVTRGIYGGMLAADGNFGDILRAPGKAGESSSDPNAPKYLTMAGKEVFKLAVRYLGEISEQLLKKYGIPPEAIDYFISHQANERILLAMARHLNVPEEKVLVNVDRFGNTSAASVPILLAEASAQGKIKRGDLLMLSAFGGGITWGAALLRF